MYDEEGNSLYNKFELALPANQVIRVSGESDRAYLARIISVAIHHLHITKNRLSRSSNSLMRNNRGRIEGIIRDQLLKLFTEVATTMTMQGAASILRSGRIKSGYTTINERFAYKWHIKIPNARSPSSRRNVSFY